MKEVCKYNIFKALSIVMTVGTPLIVVGQCSDLIVSNPAASISMTGVIAILFSVLFLKDKIAENFKLPSPFIIATVLFITILFLESILLPMKYACIGTMITTGIDELTFKRIYKRIELLLPEKANAYKHFGFICCKTDTLKG